MKNIKTYWIDWNNIELIPLDNITLNLDYVVTIKEEKVTCYRTIKKSLPINKRYFFGLLEKIVGYMDAEEELVELNYYEINLASGETIITIDPISG